jgi:hypothetical protein
MPPFDNTSALRGIDGQDVSSLRKLMNAIMHRLAGVPAGSVAEMDDLDTNEHGAMIFLADNARHNVLLSRMITRFASARYANSRTVREAARELDLVVTEAVFNPYTRPQRELVIAEGFFNQLVANGTATYGVGADEEYGDIEPDSDGEQKGKRDNKDPSVSCSSPYLMLVLLCSSPARFEPVEGSITDYSLSRLAAREPDPAMLPP